MVTVCAKDILLMDVSVIMIYVIMFCPRC